MPPGSLPNTDQNAWFTRAITDYVLPVVQPQPVTFWHTDPDRTQHERGVGHPQTLTSVRDADRNLGAVLAALERLDLYDTTNVIVASDHGFATIAGHVDVDARLVRAGLKAAETSTGVVVTGGAVYVAEGGSARIAAVAAALQGLDGVGPLFTGARGAPVLPGTLPLAAAGLDGELAPDILSSPAWDDAPNVHGYQGRTWSGPTTKAATHGSSSPWEVRNTLIAAGPDFKHGLISDVPAGNIDIAPTLIRLLGLGAAADLDGRVLEEALLGGPPPSSVAVARVTRSAKTERFRCTAQFATVGGTTYLDFSTAERR